MTLSKGYRAIATAVTASFLLTACATTSGDPGRPLTPQEQALREQAKNYESTVVEGALLGALAGGLIAAASGGNKKDVAIGVAAGAGVGAVAGNYIAKKKQQYATAEAQYNSMIADVQTENARLADLSDNARQVIASDMKEMERIDGQIAAGTLSVADAKRQMAAVDSNRKVLLATLDGLKKKEEDLQEIQKQAAALGNKAQQQQMDKEMQALRTQIAALQGEVDTLVQRRKVSRVG
ncbi:glycine zipper 2TM domain-containing protein [Oleisolibacter albus]|uniref:glycine zipper 2TM domain-containing protein n=1 Tax=Oleisolibacter albus TaxID=2171757 RepID=UPI001390612A|nr:glycine zipper 2TM domain-containing protein [Oleisolibacter albus]